MVTRPRSCHCRPTEILKLTERPVQTSPEATANTKYTRPRAPWTRPRKSEFSMSTSSVRCHHHCYRLSICTLKWMRVLLAAHIAQESKVESRTGLSSSQSFLPKSIAKSWSTMESLRAREAASFKSLTTRILPQSQMRCLRQRWRRTRSLRSLMRLSHRLPRQRSRLLVGHRSKSKARARSSAKVATQSWA